MRAQERLAAALHGDPTRCYADDHRHEVAVCTGIAEYALAADTHLAQDIEDGAALRRLRDALRAMPEPWDCSVQPSHDEPGAYIWPVANPPLAEHFTGRTIAAAADAAREALEASRAGKPR